MIENNINTLEKDMALLTVPINTNPGEEYCSKARLWQGIPAIERTVKGRLWAAYYSGGKTEGSENYVLLVKSDDDGSTWSSPELVIDPPGQVRAFDPCLWHDPLGRLWLFWAQSYTKMDGRYGVWTSVCNDSDSSKPLWSEPRRIANGIMMNKPTVLSSGEWLLPCAVWACNKSEHNDLSEESFSNVYCSKDNGDSFFLLGGADVQNRHYDEHMTVERKDGSLWMLVRTFYGIGESVSYDRGKTWSPGKVTSLGGPDSRFFIRRLKSGRLLLINHYGFKGRSNLTAMLSEDEGATWKGYLLLDERELVSYPDGVQAEDGRIYIIYDRERTGAGEILMAVFTEEDVLQGKCVTPEARLKVVIDKVGADK